MRVVVTRPKEDAARWVKTFAQHGIDAISLPLIEIRPAAAERLELQPHDPIRRGETTTVCVAAVAGANEVMLRHDETADLVGQLRQQINAARH